MNQYKDLYLKSLHKLYLWVPTARKPNFIYFLCLCYYKMYLLDLWGDAFSIYKSIFLENGYHFAFKEKKYEGENDFSIGQRVLLLENIYFMWVDLLKKFEDRL